MVEKVYVEHGKVYRGEMPHSEVCMHLRVAGKPMLFRLVTDRLVQLLREDGSPYSAPILIFEGGILPEMCSNGPTGRLYAYGVEEAAPSFGWL